MLHRSGVESSAGEGHFYMWNRNNSCYRQSLSVPWISLWQHKTSASSFTEKTRKPRAEAAAAVSFFKSYNNVGQRKVTDHQFQGADEESGREDDGPHQKAR